VIARLIDFVILALVVTVLLAVFGIRGTFVANAVSAVVTAVLYVGYFTYFEATTGQTLGKKVMKVRVVGPDGGVATFEQALKRNLWTGLGIVGVVPIIGGLIGGLASLAAAVLIVMGISKDTTGRRGWHDTFAGGTQVVLDR
jgi:uncharacterized RDD family membrane protein YckC